MPKILARDPAWLGTGTPGQTLFEAGDATVSRTSQDSQTEGPQRKIAHRGTELFVAVGNELRWSELGLLQDAGDRSRLNSRSAKESDGQHDRVYRVCHSLLYSLCPTLIWMQILKTPVARPITQLSISPSGDYLAILTTHTCHVCILPQTSSLRPGEQPLKLKSFQLGPTAHVLEQAPLICALWHPLSPAGEMLVTITLDACVRLWELDTQNRASFDEPALAIDLKKLVNATSTQSDFRASKYGANRGFSPDDVEMQVAAACFGGQGKEDEHGWSSMTLWIAMTEGDVYALCPFLPSRWKAPAALLASLSTSVVEKNEALGKTEDLSERERRIVDQQCSWLAEVDGQDPILYPGATEFDTIEVYARPDSRISPVPKLQGPFSITPEPDFGEITDIHVIAAKIDDEALYDDSYVENDVEREGLSVAIVCLATSTNEIHVCLDIEGVEAEWLPSRRSKGYGLDDSDEPSDLLLFETIDLVREEDNDDGCPTFTSSPLHRYALFVTHPAGVASLSFKPWISMLEDELSTTGDSGAGFRLNVVMDSAKTKLELPVDLEKESSNPLDTAITVVDPALGYIVLTSSNSTPFATILDLPSSGYDHPYAPDDHPPTTLALPEPEPRAPYRPAAEFSQPSKLPQLIQQATQNRSSTSGIDTKAPVKFSTETLKIFTEAHRIMSDETYRLGTAAADLFRRCERMRVELQEQIRKVAEVAAKVDAVVGADETAEAEDEDGEAMTTREGVEHRVEVAREKGAQLSERAERLRRKVGRLRGKDLSAREAGFAQEVDRLAKTVLPAEERNGTEEADGAGSSLVGRFDAILELKDKLVLQADEVEKAGADADGETQISDGTDGKNGKSVNVGAEFRKQKLGQVMTLLERETALVEAVMGRLQRLQRG